MFDTVEALFGGFSNDGVLRAELRRLFRWLKDRHLTALVTAERGDGALTRHGLEEYVSDCVILLDHRAKDQISSRRLRIVKYRGTKHGADEYPFLIDERGMSILPLASLQLHHTASDERLSSGVPDLDTMLEGKGYFEVRRSCSAVPLVAARPPWPLPSPPRPAAEESAPVHRF
jgi:circadian clock protein KaiC